MQLQSSEQANKNEPPTHTTTRSNFRMGALFSAQN